MADEPREIFPIVSYGPGTGQIRDYGVHPVDSDSEDIEAEEAMTPAPKADPVPESASSRVDLKPSESETPVQIDVDKENGKVSDASEVAPTIATPPSPPIAPSLPSSSSPKTNPGVPPLPAQVSPQQVEDPTPGFPSKDSLGNQDS